MNSPIVESSLDRAKGTEFEQLCAETLKGVSGTAVQVVAKVREYHSEALKLTQVELSNPRFNYWERGGKNQKILWGALKLTMSVEDYREFFQCWSFLLRASLVLKDSTFSIIKLNQYAEGWSQSQSQLREYHGLVHTMIMTRDPEVRKLGFSEIDMTRIAAESSMLQGIQNLTRFYE